MYNYNNYNNRKQLTKCDFCAHHSKSGCNAKPDSYYCKDAQNEFFSYLAELKKKAQNKR